MLTLYKFGSNFNLPDPSPFVMKTEILLRMSQLHYQVDETGDIRKAPKGKIPFIIDGGKTIADSSLIRFYLEQEYNIDFDLKSQPENLPSAFFAEKYCEDNLYFLVLSERWLNPDNFNRGPKLFFQDVPWFMRSLVTKKVCKNIEQTLRLQGLGRHSRTEKISLVTVGSDMLSQLLGEQNYFGGENPCGADAFIASLLCGILNDFFDSPYRDIFAGYNNLIQYTKRMMQLYYPEYKPRF